MTLATRRAWNSVKFLAFPAGGKATLTCIDYSPGEILVQEIVDLDEFLGRHRPDWSVVRWINLDGLSDMRVIHGLATKYELHPLAIEDLLNVNPTPQA